MARPYGAPWPTASGSVFFADPARASTYSRAVKQGRIRRLAPTLYTADLTTDPAALVEQNKWLILRHFVPDALIADRSAALDGLPSHGELFVVSNARTTAVRLPGLTVIPRTGPGPLTDDLPWASGVHITSDARTLLDNLAVSRSRRGRPARTLSLDELEAWLVRKMHLRPGGWLETLREQATLLASQLGVEDRLADLQQLVGAVAGTRRPRSGAAPLLLANRQGMGWDETRMAALRRLAAFLKAIPGEHGIPLSLPAPSGDLDGELPFYEAYFSNFIEGTEFSVEEARRIVDTRQVPANRPQDAHDILGTYRVVSDPLGRALVAEDAEQLLTQLKARHSAVMAGRAEKRPGQFKATRNQAGSYVFVEPALVEGTLVKGYDLVHQLPAGFARAAFMLFLISEVHPFDDGNGRIARVAMNAELSRVGQARILVPIVWRNEYMNSLRLLSREGNADVYIRVLAHAWRWSAGMPWSDAGSTAGRLITTNALVDSVDAEQTGRRLELP